MVKIAVFASGNGTNAQRIIEYFRENPKVRVDIVLTNNPHACVLERARNLEIPSVVFTREELEKTGKVLGILKERKIGFIVLAGFLWLVPNSILADFPGRVVNIHPALLPKYGGRGMYGMRVHEAVIKSGDPVTGISIHFVNSVYDEGEIIFRAECPVEPSDTPETLARKVHQLEYDYYPIVIEALVTDNPAQ
jgi:phosphoribosylglycinamide formyltransferase 1